MGSAYMTVGELSSFLMYAFWVGISIGGMEWNIRFSLLQSITVSMGAGGKKLLKDLAFLKSFFQMVFPRNRTYFFSEELMKIIIYNLI